MSIDNYFIGSDFKNPITGGQKYNSKILKYLNLNGEKTIPVEYPWDLVESKNRFLSYVIGIVLFDTKIALKLLNKKKKVLVVFDESLHQRMFLSLLVSMFSKKVILVIMLNQLAYLRRSNRFSYKLTKYIDKLMLHMADSIICAGIDVMVRAKRLTNNRPHIFNAFATVQEKIEYVEDKNEYLFLFVGSFVPFKGFEYIFKSIYLLPNEYKKKIKVVCVGHCPDEQYLSKCKKKIKKSKLDNIVELKNYMPFKELEKYYQNASLLLFPSLAENLPMTLLEGMSAGCIPIVFDIPPMNILVQNNHTGFISKTKDAKDYSEKIIKYFSLTKLQKEIMKDKILQTANNYVRDWDEVGNDFKNILRITKKTQLG